MYQIEVLHIAINEMEDAYNWYELQVPGLGDQFINEVDHYIKLIQQKPNHFAVHFSEVFRFATLRRFPYRIVYMVYEDSRLIVINSVFHTARNPNRL